MLLSVLTGLVQAALVFSPDRCRGLLTGSSPAAANCGGLASPPQSAYTPDPVPALQPVPVVGGVERRRAASVLALARASSVSSQQASLRSLHCGHTGHPSLSARLLQVSRESSSCLFVLP